jgi:hypothetical protein
MFKIRFWPCERYEQVSFGEVAGRHTMTARPMRPISPLWGISRETGQIRDDLRWGGHDCCSRRGGGGEEERRVRRGMFGAGTYIVFPVDYQLTHPHHHRSLIGQHLSPERAGILRASRLLQPNSHATQVRFKADATFGASLLNSSIHIRLYLRVLWSEDVTNHQHERSQRPRVRACVAQSRTCI